MARATRFVLVGDEKQLPPYLDSGVLKDEVLEPRGLSVDEIREPFFTHLAERLPAANVVELNVQHRMHPSIGRLVSECFYEGRLRSAREDGPLPAQLQAVAPKPVTWLTTANVPGRWERRRGDSVVNETEAAIIKQLVADLTAALARRRAPMTVAVLSAYRAQRQVLADRLAVAMTTAGSLRVNVHTVDSFQGQEAEVVIYSVTRSNREGKLGFTRERPRLNVALSRGRQLLIIVGDHVSARQRPGDNPMRDVIEHVESHPDDCALEDAPR